MTKADLVAALEKQAKLTHKQSETVINITFDSCIRALYDDDRIEIRGFGTLSKKINKAKYVRNPKTNEKKFKEKNYKIHFKIGKIFHNRINDITNKNE